MSEGGGHHLTLPLVLWSFGPDETFADETCRQRTHERALWVFVTPLESVLSASDKQMRTDYLTVVKM